MASNNSSYNDWYHTIIGFSLKMFFDTLIKVQKSGIFWLVARGIVGQRNVNKTPNFTMENGLSHFQP